MSGINYIVAIFLVIMGALFGACKESKPPEKISDIHLNAYQKTILNDYRVEEGINKNTSLDFIRYRLPIIKVGKIIVFNLENNSKKKLATLVLKDSLLLNFGKEGSNMVIYDSDKKVTRYLAWNAVYENGKIVSADNGASDWTYNYEGNCIDVKVTDRNTVYLAEKIYCYDDNKRLITVDVTRNMDFSDEAYAYQYDNGMLTGKQYYDIKNSDTTAYTISTVEFVENGLIKSYTEKIKVKTYEGLVQYKNEFEVTSTAPLVIKKTVFKNDKPVNEIRYSFNDRNHLVEYYTMGKYGEKYAVEYEYIE